MRTWTHRSSVLVITILAAVPGCGDDGESFEGVVLGLTDRYVTEGGEITVSRDMSEYESVEAQVIAADGAVQTFQGALSADGSRWEIPAVPEGEYWIVTTTAPDERATNAPKSRAMLQATARTVDFGRAYSGRPDNGNATQDTEAALTADGLKPWHQLSRDAEGALVQPLQDRIELYSFNVDAMASLVPEEGTKGAPANGDTACSGWAFSWRNKVFPASHDGGRPLVDGSKGDVLHVTQLVAHQAGSPPDQADPHDPWSSFTYEAAEASFSTGEVNMQDGQAIAFGGSLAPLDLSTFAADLRISRFIAQVTANAPAALSSTVTSMVMYQEPGTGVPLYGSTPTLLQAQVTSGQEPVDPTCFSTDDTCEAELCPDGCNAALTTFHPGDHAATYQYGNPYAGRGMELLDVRVTFRTRVMHPVDEVQESLRGFVAVVTSADDANGAAVEPLLGLPRDPRIDGVSLPVDTVTEGAGATPTITFEPPDLGEPDGYRVVVFLYDDVKDADGAVLSQRTSVLSVDTTATTVKVPEGVLESGRYYSVQITAYLGEHTRQAPFKYRGATLAQAQTYTGMFTP